MSGLHRLFLPLQARLAAKRVTALGNQLGHLATARLMLHRINAEQTL